MTHSLQLNPAQKSILFKEIVLKCSKLRKLLSVSFFDFFRFYGDRTWLTPLFIVNVWKMLTEIGFQQRDYFYSFIIHYQ